MMNGNPKRRVVRGRYDDHREVLKLGGGRRCRGGRLGADQRRADMLGASELLYRSRRRSDPTRGGQQEHQKEAAAEEEHLAQAVAFRALSALERVLRDVPVVISDEGRLLEGPGGRAALVEAAHCRLLLREENADRSVGLFTSNIPNPQMERSFQMKFFMIIGFRPVEENLRRHLREDHARTPSGQEA